MQQKRLGILAIVGLMASLAACGGGGDSNTAAPVVATTAQSTGASSSPAPAPAPAPAPTPGAVPPSSANCGMGDFSAQVLALINAERAQGANCRTKGVFAATGALRWNTRLESAALGHSTDMEQHNFFSHTGSDQRNLADRVNATGYTWSRLGENIAAGYPDVQTVVAAWMASDGHCANVMNPLFAEIGMTCVARTGNAAFNNYWTQDFGTPQ